MTFPSKRLTATEVVLLAASDLTATGDLVFSEWQLSVAAWKRDANRFGMRGFEQAHPDHKRVMKEIMGRTGAVQRGLLEKARPNYYSLTALGRTESARLAATQGASAEQPQSASRLYDDLVAYTDHRVFRAWLRDTNEPRTWLGAAAFLQIRTHEANKLLACLRTPRSLAAEALALCEATGRDQLTRGPVGGGKAVTKQELHKVAEFIDLLETRFAAQIHAILKRGEADSQ